MATAECTICIESLPLDRFRVPSCGHAFCETCLLKYLDTPPVRRSKACPQCRQPIAKADLRPVFLSLSSSGRENEDKIVAKARDVAERLGRVSGESGSKTIERTQRELEKVAKAIAPQGDSSTVAQVIIWDAVNDFKQRIAPTLLEADRLRRETRTLETSMAPLRREGERMKARAAAAEENLAKSMAFLEQLHEQNTKLKQDVADSTVRHMYLSEREAAATNQYKELLAEKSRWQAGIEGHKAQARKYKARIRELEKEVKEKSKEVEDKTRCLEEQAQRMHPGYTSYPSQSPRDSDGDSDVESFFTGQEEEEEEEKESLYITDIASVLSPPKSKYAWMCLPRVNTIQRAPQHPRFSSWNLPAEPQAKRKKANDDFPIRTDSKGRPTAPVQTGKKRKVMV
ncbi:hypothetical protein OE88DRAFT_1655579 [Heliocybe sulcata]|uniref:RING-type domain-containing protein n=1 Tax=Heliocybe sulcata TaxID=5364 RepID=A0A5C3N879_9AGAM|nr:hypothetical protein OE88DRAFT_1655579 [Heliocybe sulcata]